MTEPYIRELCDERHGTLDKWCNKVEARLKAVENRFLAMLTLLIANLLGVATTLLILLNR